MFEKYSYEEKAKILETISEQFFHRNFGRMSKTDFEVLMFDLMLTYLSKTENS